MSVLTAIFQALFQAICWVLPISESAHSAIFHDFSSRFSGACSQLTGVVHIGIAIGIAIALYKFILKMIKEFIGTFADIFKKRINVNSPTPSRHYLYMTQMSYPLMLLWLIPCGSKGLLYTVLRSTTYNGTLLDDGLFLGITGGLLILSTVLMAKQQISKPVSEVMAIAVGAASVLLIPVSGFSFVGVVFAILTIFGVSKKLSFNYAFMMSAPILLVMGIIELVKGVTGVSIVSVILALIISIATSFICVRLFKFIINKGYLKHFGIYDIALGVIIFIVGIFELILR